MIQSIDEFAKTWSVFSADTGRLLSALTDKSLSQRVADGHRALGDIAWHIVVSIPEMAERTGLKLDGPQENTPPPDTAGDIKSGYDTVSKSLIEQIKKNWTDKDLKIEDDMYGQKWSRAFTLKIIREHEIHHRGQMTVLMRQAGLKVPGLCGPSKEEWAQFNMSAPQLSEKYFSNE